MVWLAYARKALTVVVLTVLGAIGAGLISGDAAAWAVVIVGALTAAGVYVAPANGPRP